MPGRAWSYVAACGLSLAGAQLEAQERSPENEVDAPPQQAEPTTERAVDAPIGEVPPEAQESPPDEPMEAQPRQPEPAPEAPVQAPTREVRPDPTQVLDPDQDGDTQQGSEERTPA